MEQSFVRHCGAPPTHHRQSMTTMTTTAFQINGKAFSVTTSPDTPLLWVIRDVANLTGTKFGCGIGLCGACTVHLGRRAVRSCITPVSAVAGANVTTIEGLSADGQHPLQKAWVQMQAPQCGYCQSGQIMQAAALIRRFPSPTDDDIDSVMNGNLCRCMAYVRIRQAIKIAAAEVLRGVPHA
jgi:isoquinoline 1-oxidoreductase alpha subunit